MTRAEQTAGEQWLAATEEHRSLVGGCCPRCGDAAVELEADGYRCSSCGWWRGVA